jgi:spore maturation protein CgeB
MNFLIIQEAGQHVANKNFRESCNLQHSINKLEGHSCKIWGNLHPEFNNFDELQNWADVLFVLENYGRDWIPLEKIRRSKKLKIYWSIDSHVILNSHKDLCNLIRPDIHLNSTECYLNEFTSTCKYVYWFPNCCPTHLITPLGIDKTYDVGFCGSLFAERKSLLDELAEFSPKADNFVIGNDMVKAINSYKIHLNLNISNDINFRTFETLGCKTFLLTNYTPGLEKLFEIGKEIITYSNTSDLKDKIKFYLDNPKQREEIEANGYNALIKKHTYDARVRYLLRIISGISV